MSARMVSARAWAASTAAWASSTPAWAASSAACAARIWAWAALTRAVLVLVAVTSTSIFSRATKPPLCSSLVRRISVVESWSWLVRWASRASAAAISFCRWARAAVALVFLCWAWTMAASASRRSAVRTRVSMRARTWPTATSSPSRASTSTSRPASLVEMFTSVASMRPLPEAKAGGCAGLRKMRQASAAPMAQARMSTRTSQRLRRLDGMLPTPESLRHAGRKRMVFPQALLGICCFRHQFKHPLTRAKVGMDEPAAAQRTSDTRLRTAVHVFDEKRPKPPRSGDRRS